MAAPISRSVPEPTKQEIVDCFKLANKSFESSSYGSRIYLVVKDSTLSLTDKIEEASSIEKLHPIIHSTIKQWKDSAALDLYQEWMQYSKNMEGDLALRKVSMRDESSPKITSSQSKVDLVRQRSVGPAVPATQALPPKQVSFCQRIGRSFINMLYGRCARIRSTISADVQRERIVPTARVADVHPTHVREIEHPAALAAPHKRVQFAEDVSDTHPPREKSIKGIRSLVIDRRESIPFSVDGIINAIQNEMSLLLDHYSKQFIQNYLNDYLIQKYISQQHNGSSKELLPEERDIYERVKREGMDFINANVRISKQEYADVRNEIINTNLRTLKTEIKYLIPADLHLLLNRLTEIITMHEKRKVQPSSSDLKLPSHDLTTKLLNNPELMKSLDRPNLIAQFFINQIRELLQEHHIDAERDYVQNIQKSILNNPDLRDILTEFFMQTKHDAIHDR